MIYRLDIPDKSQFENDKDGVQPYYSKYAKPISMIKYTNTPYTVKNYGMDMTWYRSSANAILDSATAYTGIVPLCKFYYSAGYPPFFQADDYTDCAAKYKFKFYAPYTGNYRFDFAGSGKISKITIDGTDCVVAPETSTGYMGTGFPTYNNVNMGLGDNNYWSTYCNSNTSLAYFTEETWHSVTFIYNANKKISPVYGLIGLWEVCDTASGSRKTSVTPEAIPLSAGICSPWEVSTANYNTIVSHTVSNYNNVEFNQAKDELSTFKFKLPFIPDTGIYSNVGYKHSSRSFVNVEDALELQKGKMIEYYEGYRVVTFDNYALNLSNTDYVSVPYDTSLNCTSSLTLEMWTKIESTVENGVMLAKLHSSVHAGDFFDYMMQMTGSGGIRLWIGGFSTDLESLSLRDDNWHHVVLTADGVDWNWYIDGVNEKTTTNNTLPTNTYSQPVRMGANADGNEQFGGIIDEVKIYNRAITQAEVTHAYNDGDGNREPYSDDKLVGFWRFSEGTGTTVVDESGNSNNGTIV